MRVSFSGERLREARGELRRESVAAGVGVSVDRVADWENDRREPTDDELMMLSLFLGRDTEWFRKRKR